MNYPQPPNPFELPPDAPRMRQRRDRGSLESQATPMQRAACAVIVFILGPLGAIMLVTTILSNLNALLKH